MEVSDFVWRTVTLTSSCCFLSWSSGDVLAKQQDVQQQCRASVCCAPSGSEDQQSLHTNSRLSHFPKWNLPARKQDRLLHISQCQRSVVNSSLPRPTQGIWEQQVSPVNSAASPGRRLFPARCSEEWPIFPLSLSSVRSVASVASSWLSADCQAERLTSVQLSLLHALVAFIRRTGRVRSRRARSEVRWTAPMGIVGWREDVFVSRDLC